MTPKPVELSPGAGQMIMTLASKSGMSVTSAFRELLDNSLDAGAKRVEFNYSSRTRTLVVADNGRGTADVQTIVTPYKHQEHATTQSGRYGIGGTGAQIWLTQGRGKSEVESCTRQFRSTIIADFGEMVGTDRFQGFVSQEPNESGITGTAISISRCMDIKSSHIGSANRELSFSYTPALRRGTEIVISTDSNTVALKAYRRPDHDYHVDIDFEVDGARVRGRCYLVKPGETNQAKGWAVAYGHRFMDVFREPAGERNVDFGRLYAEVYLPREWKNINDHKNAFVSDPHELWFRLSEQCASVLDRIEQEGTVIDLEAATRVAQELLDSATGFAGEGIKGRRDGPHRKEGTVVPQREGTPHAKFTKWQPGDKSVKTPRRIVINWSSGLDCPYEVKPEANRVRITLNQDSPRHAKYRGLEGGEFLADYVLLAVASDVFVRSDKYQGMFRDLAAEHIPGIFQHMLSRVHDMAAVPA